MEGREGEKGTEVNINKFLTASAAEKQQASHVIKVNSCNVSFFCWFCFNPIPYKVAGFSETPHWGMGNWRDPTAGRNRCLNQDMPSNRNLSIGPQHVSLYMPTCLHATTYPYSYMCSFVNRNYQPSSSRSSKERPLDLQFIIVALAPKAHRDYDPRMSMLPSFPFPVLYRHTYVTHCSQSHLFVHYTYSTSLHTGGQAVVCICVVGASLGAVLLMPCRIPPPPPPNPVHWAPWSYYINYISRSFIQSNARRKTKDTLRSAPA